MMSSVQISLSFQVLTLYSGLWRTFPSRTQVLDPDFILHGTEKHPINKFQTRFASLQRAGFINVNPKLESLYLQIKLIYFLNWISIFKSKSPFEEMSNYLECQRAQYNNVWNEMNSR